MDHVETPLEMARRHVHESEERIERQIAVIKDLRAHGKPTGLAEELLQRHRDFLQIARDHLALEEEHSREGR